MVNMENQIQLYHDLTIFWLDKEWKTPREKQLEKQVDKLRQENQNLKAEVKTLNAQVKALVDRLQPLVAFENIPCKYCGSPMGNWTREEVLKAFKGWGHTTCIDRSGY